MDKFKVGDRVTIIQQGIIKEVINDELGSKYLLKEIEGGGYWSARNPKNIELIEGVENGQS